MLGLTSHRGMESRVMSLQVLIRRQQYLFLCNIFFKRMCMKICYVGFCCHTNPTAAELFMSLHDYLSGKLHWSFCVGADGALPMTGRLSGFTTCFKEVTSECECTHCVIHREMLASQKVTHELNNVWQDVIKMINHIKVCAFNSHLFTELYDEMATEHTCPLIHRSEVAF